MRRTPVLRTAPRRCSRSSTCTSRAHQLAAFHARNSLCINEDLSKLFPAKKADHGEDEVVDADGSDSSSDDAAEPQLDIPDAHLGEHRTKTIFSVAPSPLLFAVHLFCCGLCM